MRNGVRPQRLSPFSNAPRRIISQAHIKARGPLELLNREQPQRVPHQHGDAVFARSARHGALESPQAHDVGGQAQVCFGLAAARGKEQQIGQGFWTFAAVGMVEFGDGGRFKRMKAIWNGYQRRLSGLSISLSKLGWSPRRTSSE